MANTLTSTPSTRVSPLSVISQKQIHLLYCVKLCQNRPESPANKLRALNTDWISCQSSGCITHQTRLADGAFQHTEYSDAQSISEYITLGWCTARDPSVGEVGTSSRELYHPKQEAPRRENLCVFSQPSELQRNNPPACGRFGSDGTLMSWWAERRLNCRCCNPAEKRSIAQREACFQAERPI